MFHGGGQERFRAILQNFYKVVDCCLLVYDITERKSFEDCLNYFNYKIKSLCKKNIIVALFGNKADNEE